MQTRAGNPDGTWNYWCVHRRSSYLVGDAWWCMRIGVNFGRTLLNFQPSTHHNHTHSVYADYTIRDANTVDVHNYANEGGVNNIVHDVSLCAYVADPTNEPGRLAVAPCFVPRIVSHGSRQQMMEVLTMDGERRSPGPRAIMRASCPRWKNGLTSPSTPFTTRTQQVCGAILDCFLR